MKKNRFMKQVMAESRLEGTVSKFEKGWGFITYTDPVTDQISDIFVHWSDIDKKGFKDLTPGQTVTFEIGTGQNGREKAVNVRED